MAKAKKKNKKEKNAADADAQATASQEATALEEEGADEAGDEQDVGDEESSSLESQLADAEAEARQQADKALRTLAEFDNYRRRAQRDALEAGERGEGRVLRELLDLADNFDRALEHAGEDVPESLLEGLLLVTRGLHDLLDRYGVARIEAVGNPFDPEYHEALTTQPSANAPTNTVLQEVQSGWKRGDRVLRPARVIVARAVEVEGEQ